MEKLQKRENNRGFFIRPISTGEQQMKMWKSCRREKTIEASSFDLYQPENSK